MSAPHNLSESVPAGASTTSEPTPFADPVPRWRSWVALVALSLTFGVVQLDATIVNVAAETLQRELGGGVGTAQWVVVGYAVPFSALLLVGGAWGDRFGHRRTCVAGFALFAVASLLAALAGTVGGWPLLVLGRALQGLGAAVMLPASLAMIGTLHPEPRARTRALGIWGGIATTGFATGPVLGGLLITHVGWPAIFLVNVPVSLVVAAAIRFAGPPDTVRAHRSSPVGALLGVITLGAATGALILAGQQRWPAMVVALAVAAAAGGGFAHDQRHSRHPVVPPALVHPSGFRWALATGFAFNFTMYGALLCVSLELQGSYGFSALTGGLAALPMAVVVSVGATASGFLAARSGPRRPMLAGFTGAAAGAAVMAAGAATTSPTLMVVGLTVVGLCSIAMPAMTAVALDAAPKDHTGLAGGALNTARQLGGAVGVAAMGSVVNAGGSRAGATAAFVLASVCCLFGVLSTVKATR